MTVEIANLHYFDSREQANHALCAAVSDHLTQSVEQNKRASLWCSGGSTPVDFYRELSLQDLPWDKILVSLVDERWVAPTDEASNEGLVRHNLMQNKAATAEFIPFFQLTTSAEKCLPLLEKQLQSAIKGPLDVVILGLGNDGHTASLFPCAADLEQAIAKDNSHYVTVTHPKLAPYPRITLTLNRLLASRHIYLLIFGEDKLKTLNKAEHQGDERLMPIRYFLRNDQPQLNIFWAP